jgi:hypothetical protein
MTSTHSTISESERERRRELVRNTRGALDRGETLEAYTQHLEKSADQWAAWLQRAMREANCSDPGKVLPDALARCEALAADRAMAAISDLKKALKEVLK